MSQFVCAGHVSSVINAVDAAIVLTLPVDHALNWSIKKKKFMLIGYLWETGSLEAFFLFGITFLLSLGFYPGLLEPEEGY